jgi:glycosyltransferase involved in cell wall biosynthesis
MLVRHKDSNDDSVFCISPEKSVDNHNEDFFQSNVIQEYYINSHRTDMSNTSFSFSYPGHDISVLPMVQAADIINLHWVANYQSPLTLRKLFALGKPVVWTLHDQWAFTGGCHYSAGCEEYRHGCAACPQLADDPFDLPAAVLKDKLELFKKANLTIVTPSRWLADCARQSRLFKDLRIEVIPNSLETDIFKPHQKTKTKESLGLSSETVTILFGAEYGTEKRKGFHEMVAAIKYCMEEPEFQKLIKEERIKILSFGYPSGEVDEIGIPVMSLGYINSDEEVSRAYAAADVFIQSSLEDNLPNTMLEAMGCGTPVVAFNVGGMPDVIVNGRTGRLVPLADTHQMGEAILSLVFDHEQRKAMGQECRKKIREEFNLGVQTKRYVGLYEGLCEESGTSVQVRADNSKSKVQQDPVEPRTETLTVSLKATLGTYSKSIYQPILFKALKNYALIPDKDYLAVKADRDAKAEVVARVVADLEAVKEDRLAKEKVIARQQEMLEAKDNIIIQLSDELLEYKSLGWGAVHAIVNARRKLRRFKTKKSDNNSEVPSDDANTRSKKE